MRFKHITLATLGLFVAALLLTPPAALAKSLYVNADLNGGSPIEAYDIQPAPSYLVYQNTSNTTGYGGVGLAIDTDSETLFVTFEGSGTLKIVDAKTLVVPAAGVTAPNAYNLAGIVVDQDLQKVYTVDRNTDHLYVYSWNAATKTLTNDYPSPPYYVPLSGVYAAHGLALDEVNDLLYVADLSSTVKVYNTSDWSLAGTVGVAVQDPMEVALDVGAGLMYTGNAYPGYGCTGDLVKTDLVTAVETWVSIRPLTGHSTDCVVGIAVDPLTSLVYITTGNQASGGSDRIVVFDSSLVDLHHTGDIGNPTGIVVPGKEISYNPLNLTKDDGFGDDGCAMPGGTFTYQLCYDNLGNMFDVTGVTLTDTLPTELTYVSSTGTYNAGTHTVDWSIGTLLAGSAGACLDLDVTLDPTAVPESTFTNQVKIESIETGPTTVNETTEVCACLAADPIAWWRFDETEEEAGPSGSTVLDSSVNDNDGKLWNGAHRTTGLSGAAGDTAATLDGVNDHVNVGSDAVLDNLQAFTYSGWINPTATGDREIFSKNNSARELRLMGGGNLRGCIIATGGNACSNSFEAVPLGTWTHVAMTYDHAGDKLVHLYINGAEVTYAAQSTAGAGSMRNDAPWYQMLGRRQNNSRPFAGRLDEMMIFDQVLPDCRIEVLAVSP